MFVRWFKVRYTEMTWRLLTHSFPRRFLLCGGFLLGALILFGCASTPPKVRVDPPAVRSSPGASVSSATPDIDTLFSRAYAAHVTDSTVRALEFLERLRKADVTMKHYECFALLADCYQRLGSPAAGRAVLEQSLVEDSLAVGPRKRTYAEALRKEELSRWLVEYPRFPDILRQENGFIPFDVQPEVVTRTDPEFSDSGKAARKTGEVVLKALLDERGEVVTVSVEESSGEPVLDAAAYDAVRRWKFTPYKRKGIVTRCEVAIPVQFH